jgi:hypothetical protein
MELETENFFSLMGIPAENQSQPSLSFSAWKNASLELKKILYEQMYPQSSQCVLGIYGGTKYLTTLVKYYLTLCQKVSKECEIYQVLIKKEIYHKEGINDFSKLPKKTANKEKVIGYEIVVTTPCFALLFSKEQGLLRWLDEDNISKMLYIHIVESTFNEYITPPNIHRRHFYNGLPTNRKIKENSLSNSDKDNPWEIGFPQPQQHSDYLHQSLEAILDDTLTNDTD